MPQVIYPSQELFKECEKLLSSDSKNEAMSVEASTLSGNLTDLKDHYTEPISRTLLVQKFSDLSATWKYDNANVSSISTSVLQPSYQEIIGMGRDALPFILEELKATPNHWFWALKSISGEDPVPPEHRGDIKRMTEDWLSWGREKGFMP